MPVPNDSNAFGDFRRQRRRKYKKSKVKSLVEPKTKSVKTSSAIKILDSRISRLNTKVNNQVERRYTEYYAVTTVSTAGSALLINAMLPGDVNGTREGDYVTLKTLKLRIQWVTADVSQLMRVMVVLDRDSRGAAITLTELLDTTVVLNPTLAFRNLDYASRFKVIFDRTIAGAQLTDSSNQKMNVNLKIGNKVNYGLGTAGTIADISSGALYIVLYSDSVAIPNPTAVVAARLNYVA